MNYLGMMAPIHMDAIWFQTLQQELSAAAIPVRWQREGTHHITLIFINDDHCVDSLKQEFSKLLSTRKPVPLTIDKLDAFTTENGSTHIVCLTATRPSTEILELVKDVKTLADHLKVDYEKRPFKLHITLGRITAEAISIEALQSVLPKVYFPKSDYLLDDIQYKYQGSGQLIEKWDLR
ncbi:MAG: 2'-5' RNA ligase family protein [Bacteroidaceae bacterium]|nr:2'-5' RNA ligase family protein [Bacteroidaceae bacterium]